MLALLVLLAGRAQPALAGSSLTWTGGGDDLSWSDPANWSPAVVPATGDDLTFNTLEVTTNDLPAVQIHSLAFHAEVVVHNGIQLQSGGSLQGNFSLQAGVHLNGPATLHGIFDGVISGTGPVTASGFFDQANSYSGATTVDGELDLYATGAIPSGGAVVIGSGSTLGLQADEQIGSLAGDGTVVGGDGLTLTVGGNGDITTFAGTITDSLLASFSLVHTGPGTLTLSGANDYAGSMTIASGTLVISGSLTDSGVFSTPDVVVNGGTLVISGSVDQDVTVNAGGTLILSGTIGGTLTNNGGTVETLPGAPGAATATGGNRRATVSWTAPASDGGAAIIGYTVVATPGGQSCSWSSGPLRCTVTGLTNGTSYTFAVSATNIAGTGPAATSGAVVPRGSAGSGGGGSTATTPTPATSPSLDATAPTAPGSLVASLHGTTLSLQWAASTDDVGVDHYELRLDGSAVQRIAAPATSAITTVTKAGAYTLLAADAAGNRSAASGPVTVQVAVRPAGIPQRIPQWAWRLLTWQVHGRETARPSAPARVPEWYWTWAAWRLSPYRLS